VRINYTLDELRALVALHRTQSFVQAAQALHVTQPALTRRLQMLEQAVGGRLVDRTTRSVAFTALGQWLVSQAEAGVEALDQAMRTASRMASGEMGAVQFACLTTVAYAMAPALMDRFHARYPQVRVTMLDDTGQRVVQSVRSGQAEFGVGVQPDDAQDLDCTWLCDDPFVLAMSTGHALARRRSIRWRELEGLQVVALRTTSANRRHIDAQLQLHGIDTPWFDEVEHLSSLLGRLQAGSGIGVIPRLALPAAEARTLRCVPLVEPGIARRVVLMRRKGASLGEAATHLWDLFARSLKAGGARRPA